MHYLLVESPGLLTYNICFPTVGSDLPRDNPKVMT